MGAEQALSRPWPFGLRGFVGCMNDSRDFQHVKLGAWQSARSPWPLPRSSEHGQAGGVGSWSLAQDTRVQVRAGRPGGRAQVASPWDEREGENGPQRRMRERAAERWAPSPARRLRDREERGQH